MVLALGATAVTAGARVEELLGTLATMPQHLAGIRRAAALHCLDGAQLPRQQTVLILGLEECFIVFDDGGQLHGYSLRRSTRRPLTTRLMVAAASCSVASVRRA